MIQVAPSDARYNGYGNEDIKVIREAEKETLQQLERAELESRVKMRKEILQIMAQAEEKSTGRKDISDIANNRDMERRKMS